MEQGQYRRQRRHHGGARRAAPGRLAAGVLVLAGFVLVPAAARQVHTWKDDKGMIHYGDMPPSGRPARALRTGGQPSPTAVLPYELARTAQAFPVVLYTTAHCEACDQGRALLRERGIPFAERTVSTREDEQRLRELSGKNELPLLLIGRRQIAGFQAAAWQEALSAAAYPAESQLPPGYRQDPAQPAAPGQPQGVRAQAKVPPDIASPAEPRPEPHETQAGEASDGAPDLQF